METIGGYRIIRRLGSGLRADVYLGHAGHSQEGSPELAAIKVFREHARADGIDAEIAALSRLNHPHIVRLLDLATGPRNVPSLILQRLEPNGLGRLLADRQSLQAGEAVTIMAPLVAAVAAMHRAGVTHGGLGPAAVLFDGTGAPVLCGFGSSGVIATGVIGTGVIGTGEGRPPTQAQLDEDLGVAADLDAVTALATSVLARVIDPAARAEGFSRWIAEQRRRADFLTELERGLFAFADAVPVAFGHDQAVPTVPHRFDIGRATAPITEAPGEPPLAGLITQQLGKVPEWLREPLAGAAAAIRRVRKRVWVIAGVGAIAMIAAALIVQQPHGVGKVEPGAQEARQVPVQPVAPEEAMSEDPVAAAVALLERRRQCLAERSIACLETVHQPESAAWNADAARVTAVQSGGELEADIFVPHDATLIDRMGDTALISLGPTEAESSIHATASVLVIRTEAGWRIRSLLEGSALRGGEPLG